MKFLVLLFACVSLAAGFKLFNQGRRHEEEASGRAWVRRKSPAGKSIPGWKRSVYHNLAELLTKMEVRERSPIGPAAQRYVPLPEPGEARPLPPGCKRTSPPGPTPDCDYDGNRPPAPAPAQVAERRSPVDPGPPGPQAPGCKRTSQPGPAPACDEDEDED